MTFPAHSFKQQIISDSELLYAIVLTKKSCSGTEIGMFHIGLVVDIGFINYQIVAIYMARVNSTTLCAAIKSTY